VVAGSAQPAKDRPRGLVCDASERHAVTHEDGKVAEHEEAGVNVPGESHRDVWRDRIDLSHAFEFAFTTVDIPNGDPHVANEDAAGHESRNADHPGHTVTLGDAGERASHSS